MEIKNNANLEKSEVVAEMPAVCADEALAVEFFEEQLCRISLSPKMWKTSVL